MHIVFITQELNVQGGTLGFVHRWVETFSSHPDLERIDVVALRVGKYDLPDNVIVHQVEIGIDNKIIKFLNFNRILLSIFKSNKPDAVFAHMCEIYVTLSLPFTVWNDTTLSFWKAHAGLSPHIRFAHNRSDILFTSSEEGFDIDSEKKTVVGQGIDTDLYSPGENKTSTNKFRILSIGRIAPSKNHDQIIRAVAMFVKDRSHDDVHLDIVGGPHSIDDQDYYNGIKRLTNELNIQDIVTFHGLIPFQEVPDYYRRSDVMINLSDTGSLDKVVLEAMATETPVLTSNPAFDPVLSPISERLLVDKGDLSTLVDRLEWIADGGAVRFGPALRKIVVEEHGLETLIDRIITQLSAESSLKSGY